MVAEYHFRAAHPNPRTTRWLHVLFYCGALLLALAGAYELYQYATHWTDGTDHSHVWQLVLGVVYLTVAGLVASATYHHGGSGEIPPDRYVDIRNGKLIYELDQLAGKQTVELGELRRVTRPSVRELILELRDGSQQVLPVYLIDEDEKQAELERVLRSAAGEPA